MIPSDYPWFTLVPVIGLFFTILGMIAAGAWFASAQVSAITSLSRELGSFKTEVNARLTRDDIDTARRSDDNMQVQNRLARIEVQLQYLVEDRRKGSESP
jgi:hypothetical protein